MSERGTAPTPRQPARIAVRSGELADLDGVMLVMDSAFEEGFGERWTRSQCAGILPMTGVQLRLAGAASVKGFALLRVVAGEAELLLLAVAPAAQRRGVGQALLDDFVALGRAQGAHRLHLEVRDGNPAIAMYNASGFTLAGRRKAYYHGPDGIHYDALTLVLESRA